MASINTITLILLATLLMFLFPESLAPEGKDKTLPQEEFNLNKNLQTNQEKANNYEIWDAGDEAFYSIYRTYPKSSKGQIALFLSGKMLDEVGTKFNSRENLEKSIELSGELLRVYANSNLADNSQMRIARIVESRDKLVDYLVYGKVVRDFSTADMVATTKNKLEDIEPYKPTQDHTIDYARQTKTQNNLNGLTSINEISHWTTDNYTRVVIYLDREMSFESHFLKANEVEGMPPRLYVDIKGATVDQGLQVVPVDKGVLERLKLGRNTFDTVRVALYIKSFNTYKVFSLNEPFRIVMDIYGDNNTENYVATKPNGSEQKKALPSIPKLENKDISTMGKPVGLTVSTIVIDPGHGGHDPGAVGPTGLKEKEVTLAIAKALKGHIEQYGMNFGITRVVLTRDDDRFIPLEERKAIAKREHADLFISIHCNAVKDNDARGIETYILSFTNDPHSLAVATRENATTTKELNAPTDLIKNNILNSKIDESKRLASYVQTSLTSTLATKFQTVKDKGLKKAPLFVLIGADVPSILLETSFITNPSEEANLRNPEYINEIADGILKGIKLYSTEVETATNAR
jgi:N-acetylmuramoyl-L-alanine amidase